MNENNRPYFEWLCGIVDINPEGRLAELMFEMTFDAIVPNDINRVDDGIHLRSRYEELTLKPVEFMTEDCSIFEMLIALCGRVKFITDQEEYEIYNMLLDNMGLLRYRNNLSLTGYATTNIEETLMAMVNRDYQPTGYGGLFPLKVTQRDQRDVEIWFQMHEWIQENYPV